MALGVSISEAITRDRRVLGDRQGLGDDQELGARSDQIVGLPLAQDYRDLQKLIPGVQYSQDQMRGPSAGGSGQDNVYKFDGVNVSLPQYGTLSAEPASHDIAQVTVIKGGARAVDFDRAGGFSMDSVSKSGTSQFHGELSYQFQTKGMAADLDERRPVALRAGPRLAQRRASAARSVKDRLYFYGSYFRPTLIAGRTRRTSTASCPKLRQHAQRGLRQADLHADRSRCC